MRDGEKGLAKAVDAVLPSVPKSMRHIFYHDRNTLQYLLIQYHDL